MRFAIHVNNEDNYEIPTQLDAPKIQNLKRLADKGTFKCPLCNAKLRVDSGPIKGTYFTHHQGEACEEFERADQTYFTYKEQIKREEPRQQVVVALLKNELEGLAKIYPELQVRLGKYEPIFQKFVPDVVVKLGNRKYAMSVITRINRDTDLDLSKNLKKRTNYFVKLGYEPIWFVERKNVAVELGKQEIVFWNSEKELLQENVEDRKWTQFLQSITTPSMLSEILGLIKQVESLDVKSIMYLSPKDNGKLLLYRFLEERGTNPSRAYYLSEPYEMTMAEAFHIQDGNFVFGVFEKDEQNRQAFKDRYTAELERYKISKRNAKEEELKAKELSMRNFKKVKEQYVLDNVNYGSTLKNDRKKEAIDYKNYLNQFSFEKELQKMNGQEQIIFNSLIDRYNLNSINFPGICKIDMTFGRTIHTPFSVWQLWTLDQVLTTFQTKPLTVFNLYRKFRAIFRFDRNAESDVREVIHEYLRKLEYVGFLKHRNLDYPHNPFPVSINHLPLIDDFKLNSYVAFHHSRHFNADDSHYEEAVKAHNEYKKFVKSFVSIT